MGSEGSRTTNKNERGLLAQGLLARTDTCDSGWASFAPQSRGRDGLSFFSDSPGEVILRGGPMQGGTVVAGRRTADSVEVEWAPVADYNPRPLIPPGEYVAGCISARKDRYPGFKRDGIVLVLETFEGPHTGVKLERYYPAATAGRRTSNYFREWVIASGGRIPQRCDRMPPSKFKGKLFRVRVETVTKGWHGRDNPEALHYSKVAEILSLEVTNE
jgi:hypothetical protein